MHMRVDHADPKTEIQAEEVQWVLRGPQVSNYEVANIVVIQASPDAFNQCPFLLF
jgi:hypothetical protein